MRKIISFDGFRAVCSDGTIWNLIATPYPPETRKYHWEKETRFPPIPQDPDPILDEDDVQFQMGETKIKHIYGDLDSAIIQIIKPAEIKNESPWVKLGGVNEKTD